MKALGVMLVLLVPCMARAEDSLLVRQLYPVLPFVFFDSGSAELPARYQRYASIEETRAFDERTLEGDVIAKHRRVLDVIGSRLRRYPKTRVEVMGWNSEEPVIGEHIETSRGRGMMVWRYLTEVWGIDTSRVKPKPARHFPIARSCCKDPLGIVEQRRAEITTNDPELLAPIVQFDRRPIDMRDSLPRLAPGQLVIVAKNDKADLLIAPLILYKFDSPEMGTMNERIVKQHIQPMIDARSRVLVIGHTDVVGLDDRNMKLSSDRACSTAAVLERSARRTKRSITCYGRGESALYDNALQEGRFFNRTVVTVVWRDDR